MIKWLKLAHLSISMIKYFKMTRLSVYWLQLIHMRDIMIKDDSSELVVAPANTHGMPDMVVSDHLNL